MGDPSYADAAAHETEEAPRDRRADSPGTEGNPAGAAAPPLGRRVRWSRSVSCTALTATPGSPATDGRGSTLLRWRF